MQTTPRAWTDPLFLAGLQPVPGGSATVTDGVARFSAPNRAPLKSCVVNITAVQSGTGDPSPDNVRPISGWSAVNVRRTGKNLIDAVFSQLNTNTLLSNAFSLKAGTYTLSLKYNGTPPWGIYVRKGKTANAPSIKPGYNTTKLTFTIETDCPEVCITMYYINGITVSEVTDIQLELGSTATAYEPYSGTTLTVDWSSEAGTVYGGTLDVTTGVLTVDRVEVTVGNSGWTYYSQYIYRTFSDKATPPSIGSAQYPLLCSALPYDGVKYANQFADVCVAQSLNQNIYIKDISCTSEAEYYAKYSNAVIVYYLATPITYQLTPQQITALQGENNLWADSGDVAVNFRGGLHVTDLSMLALARARCAGGKEDAGCM